ncbi:MAG: hypothetical protein ABR593_12070 [Candidatus Limnocylindria bacterium]
MVIDALVARMDLRTEGRPEVSRWGVEWRFFAPVTTRPILLAAVMPDGGLRGDMENGEKFTAMQFSTHQWELAVGGPDEVALAEQAEAGLQPASWRDLSFPPEDVTRGRGVAWSLPPMVAGEVARMHIAVSWCQAGHPLSDFTAWDTADIAPSAIHAAAGVHRRGSI